MADLTGKTLGRYRVLERIGRGGMAEVYKGYQPSLDRYVAIKVLHPFLLEDPSAQDRFQREARAVAMLRHANIVQVYDYDAEGDVYFMVMEFIDGPNLKAILQEEAGAGRRLPLNRVAEIIAGIGGALGYAHEQGMVHRDVKPQNIMFTAKGQPLLTDFGIAKIVSGGATNASGGLSGTPAYMSPEQGRGGPVDARTDIYSLGVVLYEMITGRVPFDADTPFAVVIKHINDPLPLPRTMDPNITEGLERVILKAMAKSPDERFQTAAEMVTATQAAIAEAQAPGLGVPVVPRPGPAPRPTTLPAEPPAPPRRETAPQIAPAPPILTDDGQPFVSPPPRRAESGGYIPATPPGPVRPEPRPQPTSPVTPAADNRSAVSAPDEDDDFHVFTPAVSDVANAQAHTPAVGPAPAPPRPVDPAPRPAPPTTPVNPVITRDDNRVVVPPAPPNRLPLILGGVVVLLLLLAVGGAAMAGVFAAPHPATPTATVAAAGPVASNTAAVAVAGSPSAAPPSATAPAAAQVTDTPAAAAQEDTPTGPSVTPMPGLMPGNQIDLVGELKTYFTVFYQARSLAPGGRFDVETTSAITASPYREYTVDLLTKSQAQIDSGQLQQVTFRKINVEVVDQGTDSVGTPLVVVQLTRTMTQVLDGKATPQTGTYQFRLKRMPEPVDGVMWQAYDFYNPAVGKWISNGGGDQTDPSQPQ